MVSSSIRLTAWLQNSKKRAERSRDWCMSQVTAIISALVIWHHRLPVMGCANHYRDNAITYKAQRDKNARELKREARQLLTCRCASAWCCTALDAKYLKELADAKAENDALRDDVAAGRRQLHIKAVFISQCVKPPPPPAWIMQPPRLLANTAERDYFTLREADHCAKQLEPEYINEQCRWSCPYRCRRSIQLLWAIHALPAEYKCLK